MKEERAGKLWQGLQGFKDWLVRLFRQPIFLFVTLWGHASILLGAIAFYLCEPVTAQGAQGFLNAYYWSLAIATTVDSANIHPVTIKGKMVAILMVTLGSLFRWTYTALFAASFVNPLLRRVGREMHDIEVDIERQDDAFKVDRKTIEKLANELAKLNQSQRGEPLP